MTTLRAIFLLLVLTLGTTASGETKANKTAPLFTSNEILDVTIRAPFTTIMRDRWVNEDQPATLTYNDAESGEVTVELGIRARGRFRRQPTPAMGAAATQLQEIHRQGNRVCRLEQDETRDTLPQWIRGYSQALLSEHLAYRFSTC